MVVHGVTGEVENGERSKNAPFWVSSPQLSRHDAPAGVHTLGDFDKAPCILHPKKGFVTKGKIDYSEVAPDKQCTPLCQGSIIEFIRVDSQRDET